MLLNCVRGISRASSWIVTAETLLTGLELFRVTLGQSQHCETDSRSVIPVIFLTWADLLTDVLSENRMRSEFLSLDVPLFCFFQFHVVTLWLINHLIRAEIRIYCNKHGWEMSRTWRTTAAFRSVDWAVRYVRMLTQTQ